MNSIYAIYVTIKIDYNTPIQVSFQITKYYELSQEKNVSYTF